MTEKKVYEIGMLINPDLSQQEAENVQEKVEKITEKASASVISKGEVVKIDLAYKIITKIASKNERFEEAYFTWVKFELEPSKSEVIKKEVDKIKKEVFRFLIVKTVKDDEETDRFNFSEENEENEEIEKIDDIEDTAEENNLKENDDLTKIEGIGPKTAEFFNVNGINTFSDLANKKAEDLRELLSQESTLSKFDPETWPKQAEMAAGGQWDELKKWQDDLNAGK